MFDNNVSLPRLCTGGSHLHNHLYQLINPQDSSMRAATLLNTPKVIYNVSGSLIDRKRGMNVFLR